MARRRRRVRKARANPRRRRVSRRRLRANPRRRSSKRRLRRNPDAVFAAPAAKPARRKRRRKVSAKVKRRRAKARTLSKRSRAIRKRAKGMKRGIRKSTALVQAKRLSTLARVGRRGGKVSRSPVYKAMHIKSNPGIAGIIVAAKTMAPQAAVGAVAMFGLSFAGKKLSDQISKLHVPVSISPYVPAISTVLVTGLGYVVADKYAPKYKGAVAIGGLLGAIVQAVVAGSVGSTGIMAKAKEALFGPAPVVPAPDAPAATVVDATVKGLGDYTTVGGRAYADGGLFREVGDYTTVGALEARDGGAYSNRRPRRGEHDNATQWALSAYGSEARQGGAYSNQRPRRSADNGTEWATNGVDDTTEFAPGEGGVLSGGLFRGSSR